MNSKKVEKGTISANVYDEVFFITPLKPSFARNRVFAGLSYQMSKELNVATGYLWQREFQATTNRNFHYLYFALNISIDHSNDKIGTFHTTVPD